MQNNKAWIAGRPIAVDRLLLLNAMACNVKDWDDLNIAVNYNDSELATYYSDVGVLLCPAIFSTDFMHLTEQQKTMRYLEMHSDWVRLTAIVNGMEFKEIH